MKLALDCQYDDLNDIAGVAGVLFEHWCSCEPVETYSYTHKGLTPYVSGQFYKRELPCLMPLLERIMAEVVLDIIVVDGFVDLAEMRPGLGRHLRNALTGDVTVVGVAKKPFSGAVAQPVYRGESRQPLWVGSTCLGMEYGDSIKSMSGKHRIPGLLKLVDRMARDTVCAHVAGR